MADPISMPFVGRSFLYINPANIAVSSGDIDVSNDTLPTNVYCSAVFSAIKYNEPAVMPQSANNPSSRIECDLNRL
jgi:hypothetical protein